MDRKDHNTIAYEFNKRREFTPSEGSEVATSRPLRRAKLDGNLARRTSLPQGIIWDTELPGFGLRKRNSNRLTWVLKYRQRGEQRMVTLGTAGEISASAARVEARGLLAKAALADLPTAPQRPKVPLFADYAEEFWRDYAPHWKVSTRTTSRYKLDHELIPVFGAMPVDQIARADINRWRDGMLERGGTFNRCIPILSVMMRYAEQLGYRRKGSNPCRGISRYKRELPERFLSAEEYRRLGRVLDAAENANPFVVPAIRMLIYTGARVSEITTLRWRSVQVPRLALADSKTGPKTIYLNAQAIAVLESLARRGDDELVFPSLNSQRPIGLGAHWAKIRRKAALPDVRLHDLRHSFASVAIAQGIPLATIGKLLGHALPETTARYAHLADEVICESAERVCSGLASAMEFAP
jgi:integrase